MGDIKKYIPNVLTVIRIILCIPLLTVQAFSVCFFIIYTGCGITDAFDGFFARKFKSESDLGAKLDSFADLIFFSVCLFVVISNISVPVWGFIWMMAIALMRVAAIFVGYKKYKVLYSLHTYANKTAGFFVFFIPFFYLFFGITVTIILVCTITSLSSVEELAINLTSTELKLNIKSIFKSKEETK